MPSLPLCQPWLVSIVSIILLSKQKRDINTSFLVHAVIIFYFHVFQPALFHIINSSNINPSNHPPEQVVRVEAKQVTSRDNDGRIKSEGGVEDHPWPTCLYSNILTHCQRLLEYRLKSHFAHIPLPNPLPGLVMVLEYCIYWCATLTNGLVLPAPSSSSSGHFLLFLSRWPYS